MSKASGRTYKNLYIDFLFCYKGRLFASYSEQLHVQKAMYQKWPKVHSEAILNSTNHMISKAKKMFRLSVVMFCSFLWNISEIMELSLSQVCMFKK